MFERKFEFIVHQPLEICEARILALQDETIASLKASIFSRVVEADTDSIVIELHQPAHYTYANVTLTAIDAATSHASGVATIRMPKSGYALYGITALIAILSIVWALVTWQPQPLGVTFFAGIVVTGNVVGLINGRNDLIHKLEVALTQQKQKVK